jgi:hypothetical protein
MEQMDKLDRMVELYMQDREQMPDKWEAIDKRISMCVAKAEFA